MLHIILLILKIIGIVLLCIIGILLFAAACVLFVPMRYQIRLMREEGEDQPPVVVYVKVTWLLHFINVLVRYPAELIVRARVFVFTLFRIPGKEKKKKGKESAEGAKKTEEESAEGDKKIEKESSEGDKKSGKRSAKGKKKKRAAEDEKTVSEERKVPIPSTETKQDTSSEESAEDSVQSPTESDETNEKESLFDKIRQIFTKIRKIIEKVKEALKNIQYTTRKFCDKIKNVSDNIQHYREVLDSVPFRQSVELCKSELVWVLKKLKPDKFEADFIVGMEDPAATGEILAICGMLYPLIGQHIRIVGDFGCEKTHIEGKLYIRGRIRVITFIRTVVRIYFNRDIKKLIKMFMKEDV